MLSILLLALAFICFILATFVATKPNVNLTAAGLACYVLAQLLAGWAP